MFKIIALAVALTALAHSAQEFQSRGSSFNEVWDVVTVAPQDVSNIDEVALYGTAEEPTLPQFSGKLDALKSIASGALLAAAKRTVTKSDDYRSYFKKLVHANGICFSGMWEITKESKYSGYFQKGSSALMIGRISAASPQTTNEANRSFGFAGKIFPTMDADEVVKTANFFTVHDLNGTAVNQALDVSYVNEPPVDLSGVFNPLKILNAIFALADINPGVRPLYPISRAGQTQGSAAVTPKWMRIRIAPGEKLAGVTDADFRNELSVRNYPDGLVFMVDVSDTTKDASIDSGWLNIGQIRTSSMVTSFGCDRRLHFPHAKFNDPNE